MDLDFIIKQGWDNIKVGQRTGDQDHYHVAINLFDEVISRDHTASVAYRGRALAKKSLAMSDSGMEDLNFALIINPEDYLSLNHRAFALADEGEFEKALKDSDRAIELNPDFSESYFTRGYIAFKQEEFENAIPDFTEALSGKLTENVALGAHRCRGIAHYNLGNLDKAESDYAKVISLSPNNASIYAAQSVILFEAKKFKEAIFHSRQLLDLEPNNCLGYNNMGAALNASGKPNEALDYLTEGLRFNAQAGSLFANRGDSHYLLGNVEESKADYEQALTIFKGSKKERESYKHAIRAERGLRRLGVIKTGSIEKEAVDKGFFTQERITNYFPSVLNS